MSAVWFLVGVSLGACIGLLVCSLLRYWKQRNEEDAE